jgi:hypothetical protein
VNAHPEAKHLCFLSRTRQSEHASCKQMYLK